MAQLREVTNVLIAFAAWLSVILKAGANPLDVRVSKTVVKAAMMSSPFVDCMGRAKM